MDEHPPNANGPLPNGAPPRLTKRVALPLVQQAVAIAHGKGAGLSLLGLWELVLEEGLPSRAERERMLTERLGNGEGDTTEP